MYSGSAIAGGTSKTISANKPGEYRAVLTLKSNAATICEAVINLAGAPCKIYELDLSCQVPNNITLPNAVATGVQLAVGDEFTAGDYTVVVTDIISGSPTGWKGKGYVKMKLIAGIVLKQISVNFENVVVNECYELASGSVVTDYDPNWGGILDADAVISDVKDIIDKLTDLVENFTGSPEEAKKICDGLSEIEAGLPTNTSLSQFQKENALDYFGEVKTEWGNTCYACGSNSSNPNLRTANTACSVEAFKTKYSQFTYAVNASAGDCIVNLTSLPTNFGGLKEGAQRTLAGTFGNYYGGSPMTPPPCKKTLTLYKRTSSELLDQELTKAGINKANIGWVEGYQYNYMFKPLVKAIGDITGTFYGAAQRNETTLKRSADLVNNFFTTNSTSQFDEAFVSVFLNKEIQDYVQNANFMVSGQVNAVYLEHELIGLGVITIFKNVASKFAQKSFKIAAELGKANIKSKVGKKVIAVVDNGKIGTVSYGGPRGITRQKIYNETIGNKQSAITLVGEKAAKLELESLDDVLDKLIPKNGVNIKTSWGANDFINSTILDIEDDAMVKIIKTAATTKDNTAFGTAIENIIIEQMEKQTGMKVIAARYEANKGIDLLLADSDEIADVTHCIIAEIKASRTMNYAEWSFGKTVDGHVQMTTGWIGQVNNNLVPTSNGRRLLSRILDTNDELIANKIGIFVDGSGNAKILKLN